MKSQLLVATIAILSSAVACNYTDGNCYPVGQGGSSADVGVGVGVGSTGSGPSGDDPLGQAESALSGSACNSSDNNPPVEASMKVFCFQPDWGPTCSQRCTAKGLGCIFGALHPFKATAGIGLLYACNDLALGFMCSYQYDNGDACHYFFGNPVPPLCTYVGGK